MLDIKNKADPPSFAQLSEYVHNPAWDALDRQLAREFQALRTVEYSGDQVLLGWNVKYKKAGKTLCTVYPRPGHFPMLLVVGQQEKARVEALLPRLSTAFQRLYANTREGMGQRWLLLDVTDEDECYRDALEIIRIRRQKGL